MLQFSPRPCAYKSVIKRAHFPSRSLVHLKSFTMDTKPASTTASSSKPLEEPAGMESEAALLESFTQIPSVARAWCTPSGDGATITLQMSQRNLPANNQRKYLHHFTLSEAELELGTFHHSLPTELRDVIMLAPAPSGNRTLIVRSGANSTSAILEIWGKGRLLKELHVPKTLHGAVYNDGWFGTGATWSPDDSKVVYVAEAPPAVVTPEWGLSSGNGEEGTGESNNKAAPKGWRGQGEFQEDWGELQTGKCPPAMFVLDCATWQVTPVRGTPDDTSCGQPQWTPDGKALVYVGWSHAPHNFPDFPQRLGIVYCFNRPCEMYVTAWPQPASSLEGPQPSAVCLTPSMGSAFSPRFSPDGENLVFLSQDAAVKTGVHNGTSMLCSLDWKQAQQQVGAGAPPPTPRTLVDVIWTASTPLDFPGLYCTMLPDQPFVLPTTIVATTQWRSHTAVVAVDVVSGKVQRVSPENNTSWSLVGTCPGWVLAVESSPSQPFALHTAHLVTSNTSSEQGGTSTTPWLWSRIPLPADGEIPEDVSTCIANLAIDVLHVQPDVGAAGDGQTFDAVVLYSKDRSGPQPTVITPHGGPHSCYSAQFFMPLTYLVAHGYNVVLLNYRGSTGFGEASIQSLPGKVGTNDVSDCMASLKAAIAAGYVDPNRVAVVGGSHGGFLTGHLVGQHPDAFKCAVLRNPVCDLALMVHLSDIPDWCFVEAYGTEVGKQRAGSRPDASDMERFAAVSPISHVNNVKVPMMFMLGAKDRRVPLQDGHEYVAALKKRKDAPPVRTLVFAEDTHALDKPQTEFEQWINVLSWLKKYV